MAFGVDERLTEPDAPVSLAKGCGTEEVEQPQELERRGDEPAISLPLAAGPCIHLQPNEDLRSVQPMASTVNICR
jgi:hypothetical protein